MSIELWGTFSVRDHLVDRAFVADVLLYDRLVVPTLPEGEAETEWPLSWNLKKQRTLLGDLGDLAIPIPWDKSRRDTWQDRFDDASADVRRHARVDVTAMVARDVARARDPQYEDLPYRITRELLQDFANADADDRLFRRLRVTKKVRPGSVLQAVSAYPSYQAFAADVPELDTAEQSTEVHLLTPTTVFGWQFFVPDSLDFGEEVDRRLLEKAIKLVARTDFIEMREDFYQWWSDVSTSGMSAAEAQDDMQVRIAEYQKLLKGQGWKKTVRYAMKFANALTGELGLVNVLASAGAAAFLGSADIVSNELLKQHDTPARLQVAAMFHDARARLDWKAPRIAT